MMRDEPSDDVSECLGVTVSYGRVARLLWRDLGLTGTIPGEIGELSALTILHIGDKKLTGSVPPTIWSSHAPLIPVF